MKSRTKYIFIFLSIIVIRLLLDYLYFYIVQPRYDYWGYISDPSKGSYIISFVLLLPSIFLLKPYFFTDKFFISNCVILLYFIGFVPTTTIVAFDPQPIGFIISTAIYWYLFLFLIIRYNVKSFRIKQLPESFLLMLGVFFGFVVIYISGKYAHFRFTISLTDVYDFRTEARQFDISRILNYLWAASRLVLPILVSFYLIKKEYVIAIVFMLLIVLNFSIDGSKSTLFSLFICLLLFFFIKGNITKWFPVLIVLFLSIAIAEFFITDTSFIANMFIRRNFFVPSILDTKYYDLISTRGPVYWSYTVDGKDIAFYIGDYYFGREEMRANNGMFSDAYQNIGLLGCFFYPILYAIFFNIANELSKNANKGIVLLVCFLCAYKMRGSTFTTVLLTHGILLTVIVLALMPSFKQSIKK